MSPKHVWSEVGASHQDSTSAYSEMPGELDMVKDTKQSPVYEKGYPSYDAVNRDENVKYKNKQHEKAMKAPVDPSDAIRKAGW